MFEMRVHIYAPGGLIAEITARKQGFMAEKPFSQWSKLTEEDSIKKYKHNVSMILPDNKIGASVNTILELNKLKDIKIIASQITIGGKLWNPSYHFEWSQNLTKKWELLMSAM